MVDLGRFDITQNAYQPQWFFEVAVVQGDAIGIRLLVQMVDAWPA